MRALNPEMVRNSKGYRVCLNNLLSVICVTVRPFYPLTIVVVIIINLIIIIIITIFNYSNNNFIDWEVAISYVP